jgi:uncharacterized DUF497 family protein
LNERQFQFEWDEVKAAANERKHGVSFELAATVFGDPRLLAIADLEHSKTEERWFSIGYASNGAILSIIYVWSDSDPTTTKVRLISARKATRNEVRQYHENL